MAVRLPRMAKVQASRSLLRTYLHKMSGTTVGRSPRVLNSEVFWSWIGALIGVGVVGWLGEFILAGTDLTLMIGSYGASAVLLYGAPRSPLAQPRNLLGGHFFSALIGVFCWQLLPDTPWAAAALAVASSIAIMHLTRTLHPPGGATAMIAVIGSPEIQNMGYLYALIPGLVGPLILLAVALLVNNLPRSRRYPETWH
jgi:CBS-domain-containing membrane protein